MTDLQHALNVSVLAQRIGQQMQMSDKDCAMLSVAGMLHDIGYPDKGVIPISKRNAGR